MNKKQATELSERYYENFLEVLPIVPYGTCDLWEIYDEWKGKFAIRIREFDDGSCQLGINMSFAMNKFKDCPIVCEFPKEDKDWDELFDAMKKLLDNSYPENCHEFGSYLKNIEGDLE